MTFKIFMHERFRNKYDVFLKTMFDLGNSTRTGIPHSLGNLKDWNSTNSSYSVSLESLNKGIFVIFNFKKLMSPDLQNYEKRRLFYFELFLSRFVRIFQKLFRERS